jgi:multidrug resistance efflux pump
MTSLLNTRTARLLLTVAILAALGLVASDRALYRTSIDAVVNAPRVEVVAPVEGTIATLPGRPGRALAAGSLVATLRRAAWSQGMEHEAGARLAHLQTRVATLEAHAGTLRALAAQLSARVVRHRTSHVAQLGEAVRAAALDVTERRAAHERLEALARVQGATVAELATARAGRETAEARLARAEEALRAARAGVLTDQGAQDVPYSQQRHDEVTMQLATLDAARAQARTELATLAAQMGGAPESAAQLVASTGRAETGDAPGGARVLDVLGDVAVPSPGEQVVWSVNHAPGSLVLKGTVLATMVDCADVFLEARVSTRDAVAIQPGAPVRFHFAGESREVPGRVAYVRGGAVRDEVPTVARLTTEERAASDGRVVITLDARAIGARPENFCQVGRSGKVRFGTVADGVLTRLVRAVRGAPAAGALVAAPREAPTPRRVATRAAAPAPVR